MASINDTVPNWLIGTTYNKYAIVSYNSKYYYSLRDGNVGNTPSSTLQTAWDGYIAINALILPNFFWKPSYNSIVNSEPKVVKVQFGNGYQQRIPDGINSNLLNMELQFENKTEIEAVSILHFLAQRKGYQSFIYNVPTTYSKSVSQINTRFICENWTQNYNSYNNYSIKTIFREVPV